MSPGTRCGAPNAKGQACRAWAATGSERCALHGENAAQEIAARHQAAAKARAEEATKVTLETAEDCRKLVEETAQRLRAGLIPANVAIALDRLARSAQASIDSALLEQAQAEIAASKATRPAGVRRR